MLNNILEQKLYSSNNSPRQELPKEHSLSLNDINAQIYNFDYPRKQEHCEVDANDDLEDDKLLQSLEKRFSNYDQQAN